MMSKDVSACHHTGLPAGDQNGQYKPSAEPGYNAS